MGKFLMAAMAFAVAGYLSLSTNHSATAAPAAHIAKIPAFDSKAQSPLIDVAWKLKRSWHKGCQRWRWAKHRKWICNSYGKCHWKYSGYYWGACYRPPAPKRPPAYRPPPRPRY